MQRDEPTQRTSRRRLLATTGALVESFGPLVVVCEGGVTFDAGDVRSAEVVRSPSQEC